MKNAAARKPMFKGSKTNDLTSSSLNVSMDFAHLQSKNIDEFIKHLKNLEGFGFQSEEEAVRDLRNLKIEKGLEVTTALSKLFENHPEILFNLVRAGADQLLSELVTAKSFIPKSGSLDLNKLVNEGKSLVEVLGDCFEEAAIAKEKAIRDGNGSSIKKEEESQRRLTAVYRILAFGGNNTLLELLLGESSKKAAAAASSAIAVTKDTALGWLESYYYSLSDKGKDRLNKTWGCTR